jgi:hypothetical protein
VPFLTYAPAAFAGAATALGVMGVRAVSVQNGIRVIVALVIGTALGYIAEHLTGIIMQQMTKARSA